MVAAHKLLHHWATHWTCLRVRSSSITQTCEGRLSNFRAPSSAIQRCSALPLPGGRSIMGVAHHVATPYPLFLRHRWLFSTQTVPRR
eukprot:4016931-Prymnesium_polylepis.1